MSLTPTCINCWRTYHRARSAERPADLREGRGGQAAKYQVRHSGKRLEVAALYLSGTLDEVLARVELAGGNAVKCSPR